MGSNPRRKQSVVRLFNEQGSKCIYCGVEMTLKLGLPNTVTKDHIIPRSKGGVSDAWNIVAACSKCNSSKKDNSVLTFLTKNCNGPIENHPFYMKAKAYDMRARNGGTQRRRFSLL